MIKSVFGYTWIKGKLIFHRVASTEQGEFETLPSSVGKQSFTVLGEMTVCHALIIYGAEHL